MSVSGRLSVRTVSASVSTVVSPLSEAFSPVVPDISPESPDDPHETRLEQSSEANSIAAQIFFI